MFYVITLSTEAKSVIILYIYKCMAARILSTCIFLPKLSFLSYVDILHMHIYIAYTSKPVIAVFVWFSI
jgi:hypothetical protein